MILKSRLFRSTPKPGSKTFREAFAKTERVLEMIQNVYERMQLPTYDEALQQIEQQAQNLLEAPSTPYTPVPTEYIDDSNPEK